jgi:tetratricopeptide (TPR) repeat protein
MKPPHDRRNARHGESVPKNPPPSDLPLWKKILFSLVMVTFLLAVLEGTLAIVGLRPAVTENDPFVGFASTIPLFVEAAGADGAAVMRTADNKSLFNYQEFPRDKSPGTYRIFCVGGSTTFGRPFDDTTSFSGWLRELLPIASPNRRWEVINAGGVSYASYRVARLMKELTKHEPDLFVVYSGQNEFLEERTYRDLKRTPGVVRSIAALLARTRTWAAMSRLLDELGLTAAGRNAQNIQLAGEADTLLEHFGPDVYERDDQLREQVLRHYRVSLQRMVDIARSAGAEVIFVKPASNLKDCSPFKSQHTDGISEDEATRSEQLLAAAQEHIRKGKWTDALDQLDAAIAMDPRYAELHYRRGEALLELDRLDEARAAFDRALDEDVCPLRALPEMLDIVDDVAHESKSPVVDFAAIIERTAMDEHGHRIPGEEFFLDHVHPTIAANGMLAAKLVDEVLPLQQSAPSLRLDEDVIAAVQERIESRLDPAKRARSLSNLAKVLAWAGKIEDAVRPAHEALAHGVDDPLTISPAASILATWYAMEGDDTRERQYFRIALNSSPRSPEIHWRIGLRALDREPPEVELACAHILLSAVYWDGPRRDGPHQMLAEILASRGRWVAALSHLLEARSIEPGDPETASLLARARGHLGPAAAGVSTPKFTVDEYSSGTIRRIIQVKLDPEDRAVADGIWTEWHEGGEPLRYLEVSNGVPDGVEVAWDEEGRMIARTDHSGVPQAIGR